MLLENQQLPQQHTMNPPLYNNNILPNFENNEINVLFFLNKINSLESKLSLPLSTIESLHFEMSQMPQLHPQPYIPQPYTPPQQSMTPILYPQQPQQIYQPQLVVVPQQIQQQYSSISYYFNNSYRYIMGSPVPITRMVSLGHEFTERWDLFSKNLMSSAVDTLILLDGFNQEIPPNSLPTNIKYLHVGNVGPLVNFKKFGSIPSSVIELHLHDGCNISLTRYSLSNNTKSLHLYNVTEPLNKESIGHYIEVLHIHDGFNKSLGNEIIPNSVHELHLYNINVPALSMPIGLCTLYLHNGFNLPITISTISKNVKDLHLFNLGQPLQKDSIPLSVRNLYLHNGFNQSGSLCLPSALKSLYLYDILPLSTTCFPTSLQHIYLNNYRHNLLNVPKKVLVQIQQ